MTSHQDFGWWIESTDEEIYGPVTKATLLTYLNEGVISPNTSVRHCTSVRFAPIADLGWINGQNVTTTLRTGDKLSTAWPRKTKERRALAESEIQCAYHRRPAILSCIRCLAPYCAKCQMHKSGKTYFMCKKCQSGIYNRRTAAYMIDSILLILLPTWGIGIPAMLALGEATGPSVIYLIQFAGTTAFLFRDPMFGGAGPGKRFFGLKVVKQQDGESKPSYGQGFMRSLIHLVPIFNLVDASVPYKDPFQRRFGDSWAKTRVINTDAKIEAVREKIRQKLAKKKVEVDEVPLMTIQEFAQIV